MLYSAILKSPSPLGAAAITLIAVLALSLGLALAGARSTLSRAIETLVRRFPTLSPICNPVGNLLAATIIVGIQLDYGCRNVHILNALRYFPTSHRCYYWQ